MLLDYGTRAPARGSRTIDMDWEATISEIFLEAAESRLAGPVGEIRTALARSDKTAYSLSVTLKQSLFPSLDNAQATASPRCQALPGFHRTLRGTLSRCSPSPQPTCWERSCRPIVTPPATACRGQLGDAMGLTVAKTGNTIFQDFAHTRVIAVQPRRTGRGGERHRAAILLGKADRSATCVRGRYRESLSHGAGFHRPGACHLAEPEAYRREVVARAGQPGIAHFAITETSRLEEFADLFMLKLEAIGPEPRELRPGRAPGSATHPPP